MPSSYDTLWRKFEFVNGVALNRNLLPRQNQIRQFRI